MKITVRQYYAGFVSLFGLAAGAPFVPPLLHAFIPDTSAIAQYLYPPLGDVELIAVAATIGILLATTFVVFSCCEAAQNIHPIVPAVLTIGSIVGLCVLIALYIAYVRRIPVTSAKLEVPVSVGYQRTDFANENYPRSKWSDWQMLHDSGPWEETIQKLWVKHSIIVVRISLWIAYTLTLTCFLSVVSLAVYRHISEEHPSALPVV